MIHDQEVVVGTSIGVSLFPYDGVGGRAAAQERGHGPLSGQVFGAAHVPDVDQERAHSSCEHQKRSRRDLRQAIRASEFVLHYQPQIDIARCGWSGMEALIRWHHPVRGLLLPEEFIPIAEETRMHRADRRLGAAPQACAARGLAGPDRVPTSGRGQSVRRPSSATPGLVELVAATLREPGLQASALELEITESVLLQHTEADSTSCGSSSSSACASAWTTSAPATRVLACLRRFPFDLIKIDRSFIRDLEHDPEAQAIVRAAVSLSRSLRMRCLAEGVETREQLQFLKHEGCAEVQGFYFSRPVSARDRPDAAPAGRST